jgi:chemotaxis protein CheX
MMDADIINAFIAATVEILSTVGSVTADVQKPFLKKDPAAQGDVTSIVEMTGNTQGTISISFSSKCILSVVSNMFGEEVTKMDDDIKDAVGEITNMISGQASQLYEKNSAGTKVALSQVLMEDGHSIPHTPNTPVVGIPVNTEKGDIYMEFCFKA